MLQFITHANDCHDTVDGVREALAGGCRWVQLRMKHASDADLMAAGRIIRAMCSDCGATFVLDDRVHLVGELNADGVHLGKNDMPVDEARHIIGEDILIGATANTFADIQRAATAGADYIGLGPYRFTTTKEKLSPTLGTEGYSTIMALCRTAGIKLPVVAIGGITATDIHAIMRTGVNGIALSGAILNADDPAAETAHIINLINNYTNKI